MLPPAMVSDANRKSALNDPLLILVALLLLLSAGATLYFALTGPSKEYAHEPGARPRPIITNQIVVVNVQEVVVGTSASGGHGTAASAPAETKPAAEAAPVAAAAKPAEAAPAVVTLNPPKVSPTADGKVRGKVLLKGTPAPEAVIGAVKADANCGKIAVGTPKTRGYMVGADGGLKNVLVRIVKAPAGAGKMPESPLIDQVGCMYEPYVTAVMVGETFKVKNSDPIMHNVNATPKINKGFNFAQASAGQVNEKSFEKPELNIRFSCNVHPWMIAYISVVENPFFAMTGEDGSFQLPDGLPPGKYELEINHIRAGTSKQEIEVAAGKGAEVVFELAPAPAK